MAAGERQRLTRPGETVSVPARRETVRSFSHAEGMAAKILGMQQTLGNQAVQQRASTCPAFPSACPTGGACHTCPARVQAKLTVSQPGDKYEQEADHVAERVVESIPFPGLQHKYASGGQRYPLSTGGRGEGEGSVPPVVHEVLRSPGQPLDPEARTFMESRFGHDFSQVRVHTDAKAAESAQAVNALAYTVGRDVVFGAGQYTPGTTAGKRLLAHELTHILQQNAENPQASSGPMRIGAPQDRYESEADRAASTALGNRGVAVHLIQHAPSIQRSDGLRLPEMSFRLRPPPFRLTDTGERHFRVYFDKGIYIIPRFGESETIERVAEIHLSDPSLHVVLEGHASTEGPTEFNRRLSENRATAVKMLLIARGVAASRIRERGLGESEPAVEETASDPRALEEQRQQNRRVEIFIVSVPTLAPPRLLPTMEELLRIIDDPTRTPEERDLARALRDIGPSEAGRSSTLEDLVERVKRHIELRAGDYVIKPDLETIFKGLKDLLGR